MRPSFSRLVVNIRLMTDTAYRDLGREMDGQFLEGTEVCDGFGLVKTYVQLMGEAVERSRDALYALPPKALASRALDYVIWDFVRQPRALLEQMRHPVARVGWWRSAGFALTFTLVLPVPFFLYLFTVPRRLLSRRAKRLRAGRREQAIA